MQTRTYSELFSLIQALCGVVFASIEAPRIKALINRRALRAYRSSNYWTRFLKIGEERRLSGDSVSVVTTVVGSPYYINTVGTTNYEEIGLPWKSVFDGSISGTTLTVSTMTSGAISIGDYITDVDSFGDVRITAFGTGSGGIGTYTISSSPGTYSGISIASQIAGAYFVATSAGSGTGTVFPALNYIPYTQSGLSGIDSFMRVYKQAPYIASSVQEYDIMVTSAGATLIAGDLNPATAFVTYKAQLADTYGNESGETSNVPAEWYQYIAHGTYADYLRAEGQQDKAMIADQEADMLLQDELIRLDENHASGLVSNRIFTNANMQMRY